jgi:hypothetical protein
MRRGKVGGPRGSALLQGGKNIPGSYGYTVRLIYLSSHLRRLGPVRVQHRHRRLAMGSRVIKCLSAHLHRHVLNHSYDRYIFEHVPTEVGTY